VEDWAEIRRLHRAEGMAIRAIARRLGISKNTVKAAQQHRVDRDQARRHNAARLGDRGSV